MQKKVGILIFDDVEVLDFCGPFEVLTLLRLDENKRTTSVSPFDVKLISPKKELVITKGGMKVLTDYTFKDSFTLDILIVAGGFGTRELMYNKDVLEFVKRKAKEVELLSSICTGALILANAKILDGYKATTHWKSLKRMKTEFKDVKVCFDKSVVEDRDIITSAGISAGIDMALYIIKKYFGEKLAKNTAKHMEYQYMESNKRKIEF